ncbi:MAG TPA: helix-turn-helix transcriptional regulator [Rhodothermales bacterium]|nr:helix-turn-helix transcriptional regulator [Rhodothermales bacterium]
MDTSAFWSQRDWGDWMRGATVAQLQELNRHMRAALARVGPIEIPTVEPSAGDPDRPARLDEYRRWRESDQGLQWRRGAAPAREATVIPPEQSGAALRALREAKGLSQREAAALIGSTRGVVDYIEGDGRPYVAAREKLLAALRAQETAPPSDGPECAHCGYPLRRPHKATRTTGSYCKSAACQRAYKRALWARRRERAEAA